MSKYNGWTNYATWRIDLEIFDGSYDSKKVSRTLQKKAVTTKLR